MIKKNSRNALKKKIMLIMFIIKSNLSFLSIMNLLVIYFLPAYYDVFTSIVK